MKYLSLLLLILTLALAQTPNCNIRQARDSEQVFITINQSYAYSLSNFFTGFNLEYTVTGEQTSYELIQPFSNTDTQIVPNITQNYSLLDFDIQSDGNQAWERRVASLGYQADEQSYYIRYGFLNGKMNAQITNMSKVAADGEPVVDRCFDVVALNNRMVVDCQINASQTDVLYVFNQQTKTFSTVSYQNSIITKQRKTVTYRLTDSRTYLVSAWLKNGLQQHQQSFLKIYQLDHDNIPQNDTVKIIKASDLQVDNLQITDITVDALENIYVTDARGILFQFKYDGEKIYLGERKNFGTRLQKVSVHVTHELDIMIQVVGNQNIYEINSGSQPRQLNYELPANVSTLDKIIDFQTNDDLLVIQTIERYYVYSRYVTELNNLLDTFLSNGSRFALSPRTPNIIFLGNQSSVSKIVSKGFLITHNPKEVDQVITVTATSYSIDKSKVESCNVTFKINNVNDLALIYTKRDFQGQSKSSGENPSYYLDDYFLGSKLSYSAQGDGVNLKLKHVDSISLFEDTNNYEVDWFSAFSHDGQNYYRVSVKKGNMIIQYCNVDGNIKCSVQRTLPFTQNITHHEFFKTTFDLKSSVPMMVFTTRQNPHNASFIQLDSDRTFPKVEIPLFPITDLDANERFVFITVTNGNSIYVLKNDLDRFNVVKIINKNDFPFEHDNFKPLQSTVSTSDINLLIIKNYVSIIIMRVTAFTIQYISQIQTAPLDDGNVNSKIVIAGNSLLLFIDLDTESDIIEEYTIFDIYNPRHMRTISNLFGVSLRDPIEAYSVGKGELVAVRTTKLNDQGSYLTIIKPGQPLVGSIYQDTYLNSKVTFQCLVGLSDNAILEKNVKNLNSHNQLQSYFEPILVVLPRFYYRPTLTANASINQNYFKQDFNFTLKVNSTADSKTINNTLSFYNIRSKIRPSAKTADKISFPNNANSDEVQVVIPADKQFDGPIVKYNIECPYCGNQIKLKDHVSLLASSDKIANVRAFYYFEDKNRLWALTDSAIQITDGNLNFIVNLNFTMNATKIRAQAWAFDSKNNIQILFTNSQGMNDQFFLTVTPSQNRQSATFQPPIQVSGDNLPRTMNVQVMKILGNRIFVLENSYSKVDAGVVNVYTISDSQGTDNVKYEYTINAGSQGINDFQILSTQVPNLGFFIATVSNKGLLFISFDISDAPFTFANSSYDLNTNPSITKYIADSSFLQLEIYSSSITVDGIQLGLYMTVENGLHQQFSLKLKNQGEGYIYESLSHINSFGKYGNQTVINWAQILPYKDHGENILLVGHSGSTSSANVVSLGLFNRDIESSSTIQQMTGAVEIPTSNKFAALMFSVGGNVRVVQSTFGDDKAGTKLYNLSNEVSIVYKYEQAGDFDQMKLVAFNQYGSSSKSIPVQFQGKELPGGLAWYIILVIALGGLLVVGLIVFCIIKYKKGASRKKQSLLATVKSGSDDDDDT